MLKSSLCKILSQSICAKFVGSTVPSAVLCLVLIIEGHTMDHQTENNL